MAAGPVHELVVTRTRSPASRTLPAITSAAS